MEGSSLFHIRTCNFSPQDLSHLWCHSLQQELANRGPASRQHSPSSPSLLCPERREEHPCSLLKRQQQFPTCRLWQTQGVFSSVVQGDDPGQGIMLSSWRKNLQKWELYIISHPWRIYPRLMVIVVKCRTKHSLHRKDNFVPKLHFI